MFDFYSSINLISSVVLAFFGYIIWSGSKSESTRTHSLYTFLLSLWALSIAGFYLIHLGNDPTNLYYMRYLYWIGLPIFATFFYFTLVYPSDSDEYPRLRNFLVFYLLTSGVIYIGTSAVVSEIAIIGSRSIDKIPVFGKFFYLLFNLPYGFFIIGGHIILFKKIWFTKTPDERKKLIYLFVASAVLFLPTALSSVILPAKQNFDLAPYGPTISLAWVLFTAYMIFRQKILKVKILVPQVLILALAVILFINIFFENDLSTTIKSTDFGMLSRFGIFASFAVVGGFFIKNIIKNEDQKERLAKLKQELESLNVNLITKVDEQTAQFVLANKHTETVVENLSDGLIEYAEDFTIRRVNRAAERMLGVSRELLINHKITPKDVDVANFETVSVLTFPVLATESKKILQNSGDKRVSSYELKMRPPSTLEFSVITVPISSEKNMGGFIKIIRDITRIKLVSRSKSEFISVAAHQLRTPLSILKWTFDSALARDFGQLEKQQEEMILRGINTNQKIITLVNDLLNVARIEDGRFEYSFKKDDLGTLLLSISEKYKKIAGDSQINFSYMPPEKPIPPFSFDDEKISMAIENIIGNSFTYTKTGGTITCSLKENGPYAEIEVRDSGIGIPERDRGRVFAKFFRAENAVRMYTEGSGLGLFIVHNIIARHGGTTEITQNEPAGTIVKMSIAMEVGLLPTENEPLPDIT